MNTFPSNFIELHEGEESLRCRTIAAIEANEKLLAHAFVIESSIDLLHHFIREYECTGDELTIQLLGIRLFNSAASAFKLLLSGYYQNSAAAQRDLIETTFLLDYFKSDTRLISMWRESDKKQRNKLFAPATVRDALDARDGYKGRKRGSRYQLYCELASHPTYHGFSMLTSRPDDKAICGPFFNLDSIQAVLGDLAIHMVQASSIFADFFSRSSAADCLVRANWLESSGKWYEQFGGPTYDPEPVNEIRAALVNLSHS